MKHYTVTTYGCAEWLCRTGRIRGELIFLKPHSRTTMADIKQAVCDHYELPIGEMTSARRSKDVARPRQVSMYLCKQLLPKSLPEIGRGHGNRDHTTVIHAVRRIEELRADDHELSADIEKLAAILKRPCFLREAAR